jgi:hypothetical protein
MTVQQTRIADASTKETSSSSVMRALPAAIDVPVAVRGVRVPCVRPSSGFALAGDHPATAGHHPPRWNKNSGPPSAQNPSRVVSRPSPTLSLPQWRCVTHALRNYPRPSAAQSVLPSSSSRRILSYRTGAEWARNDESYSVEFPPVQRSPDLLPSLRPRFQAWEAPLLDLR